MRGQDDLIPAPEQIGPEWLTGRLRENGFLDRGRVASVAVEPFRNNRLSDILRLRVGYSGEALAAVPTSLIIKFTKSTQVSARSARRGRKENRFCALVAPNMGDPPVPVCYDAVYDPDMSPGHLLLEDLSESHDRPLHGLPPTREQAEQNVDCLAWVRAGWWNDDQLGAALGLRAEGWYGRRGGSVEDLFARFVEEAGAILSPRARGVLEAVAGFHPTLLEREANGNVTVANGEALCWSFLHPRGPAVRRPCLID